MKFGVLASSPHCPEGWDTVPVSELSIWDKARPHTYAELDVPGGVVDVLASAETAVDALFSLGDGLFEPLAVNVEIACCDVEFGYPLGEPRPVGRFHQLRLATSPETVMVPDIWNGLLVSRTERLDRAAVVRWFGTILSAQQCPQPDTTTGWTELIVEAVRARLPEAVGALVDGDELLVPEGSGVIRFPVERVEDTFWVAGPLAWRSGTSPFHVAIVNEAGALSLDWSRNWSPWIEPDGPGRPDVEAAVRRLSALGWAVTAGLPQAGSHGFAW